MIALWTSFKLTRADFSARLVEAAYNFGGREPQNQPHAKAVVLRTTELLFKKMPFLPTVDLFVLLND